MEKTTNISVRLIEPEFDYEEGSLIRSKTRPVYWSRLGSSKSRTKEQELLGKEVIMDLMMETPQDAAYAFTDGSCLTNPGPCGAGAVIYPSDGEPVLLTRPVTRRGSILLAELVAVLMVLEHVIQYPQLAAGKLLQILSDSQSVVGIITQGWNSKSHRGVIQEIRKAYKTLSSLSITVELLWTPGHSGLQGNEKADQLAKEGAEEAKDMPENMYTVTIQDIKDASHKSCVQKWQTRWDNSSTGRKYYEIFPTVDHTRTLDHPDKMTYNIILQLQTGYSSLNAHRSKIGQNVSPLCGCGRQETTEHFLLECNLYDTQREELLRSLNIQIGILSLDIQLLLGNDGHPHIDNWRTTIQTELGQYIRSTGRFPGPSPAASP